MWNRPRRDERGPADRPSMGDRPGRNARLCSPIYDMLSDRYLATPPRLPVQCGGMLESFMVSEPTEEDRDPRQTRAPSTLGGPRLGAASVPRRIGPDNPRSHDVMHADRVSQPPLHIQPDCLPVARGRWNAGSLPFRAVASRVKSGQVGSKNGLMPPSSNPDAAPATS